MSTGEGFLVVEGEVGTGKTLLLRRLLNSLPPRLQAAFVPNPGLDPRGLYAAIAIEFGLRATGQVKCCCIAWSAIHHPCPNRPAAGGVDRRSAGVACRTRWRPCVC